MSEKLICSIVRALRAAADVAIRLADPEWCELIFVSLTDELGKVPEPIKIGAMPARTKVSGEVARLYLHINDPMSFAVMRDAIRLALEPFFVRERQLVLHDIRKESKSSSAMIGK
jgi:hypothetical protein